MKKVKSNWNNSIYFGEVKETGEKVYLSAPSWDCNWYWGFGYLGNKNCHYHLSSYQSKFHTLTLNDGSLKTITECRNINMYDALLTDYDLPFKIKDSLWKFCELATTVYFLKETAEILGRGGSHYTVNECKDVIINPEEVIRINEVVLPSLFNAIHKLL